MIKKVRCLALMLSVLILFSAAPFRVTAQGQGSSIDEYEKYLISLGFPADYAAPLAALHAIHPSWEFAPLMVTKLNPKYTWDYVISMETEASPSRSLVPSSSTYSAYHHPTNKTKYDTSWYQASVGAVEYFMDPRNFLNEKDIFQFENVEFSSNITIKQVEAALSGTFMSGAYLENGKTYAEYFYEVGKELDVNPIHLASRARQEQATLGSSSLISGLCGDKLAYYYVNQIQTEGTAQVLAPSSGHTEESLKAYNGLYNVFNVNASGKGTFAILLSAMKQAKTGTPSKAAEWGNGGAWDTRWKAIYGGALVLAERYIKDYQNTLYLQKWNVDNRSSRNFYGQYMQHIGAALAEARTAYTSKAKSGGLDNSYSFLIPVYSGMPAECPDPALGYCGVYAMSDAKYSYRNKLILPTETSALKNNYLSVGGFVMNSGENLNFSGWSVHTYGLIGYEYSIDGGEWIPADSYFSQSVADENPNYPRCLSRNSFDASVALSGLAAGKHSVVIRGVSDFNSTPDYIDCGYYLIAEISFEVKTPAAASVTLRTLDGGSQVLNIPTGSVYTLPSAPILTAVDSYFAGWVVDSDSARLFLPAGAVILVTGNITVTPVTFEMRQLEGGALRISEPTTIRFSSTIAADDYTALMSTAGQSNVKFGHLIVKSAELGALPLTPTALAGSGVAFMDAEAVFAPKQPSGRLIRFTGDSAPIMSSGYSEEYTAAAYVRLVYSNGAVAVICTIPDRQANTRSAKIIASAALADMSHSYSEAEKQILERIAK